MLIKKNDSRCLFNHADVILNLYFWRSLFFVTCLMFLSQMVNAGNRPLVPGWLAPDVCPLPSPPSEPVLQHDRFIKGPLQDADTSIDWYEKECRKRKALEAINQEYSFEPLRCTLHNMLVFTDHILEGKQFPQSLTEEEHAVFSMLRSEISSMYQLSEVPYKAAVVLSLKFTLIYELLLSHKFYDGLAGKKLDYWLMDYNAFSNGLTLRELYGFSWSPNENARKICEGKKYQCQYQYQCLCHRFTHYQPFFECLNNPDIILYPGYEPLGLEDFVRFGHLPVYPLRMFTSYGMLEGGGARSPARLYIEDLNHSYDNPVHEHLKSRNPLHSPRSRLNYRLSMLDNANCTLERNGKMKKVFIYAIFDLFHEHSNNWRRRDTVLDSGSFLGMFQVIQFLRKRILHIYPDYYDLTDEDAWRGSLWLHRLHQYWISGGAEVLTEAEIETFYHSTFLPCADALSIHMQIAEGNKKSLISFFNGGGIKSKNSPLESCSFGLTLRSNYTYSMQTCVVLLVDTDSFHGSPAFDNADLFYLELIRNSEIKAKIEQAIGVRIPEMCEF